MTKKPEQRQPVHFKDPANWPLATAIGSKGRIDITEEITGPCEAVVILYASDGTETFRLQSKATQAYIDRNDSGEKQKRLFSLELCSQIQGEVIGGHDLATDPFTEGRIPGPGSHTNETPPLFFDEG